MRPWLPLLACACASPPTTTGDSAFAGPDTATTPPSTCVTRVTAVLPADGDAHAFYRGAVWADLAEPAPEAVIAVRDAAGTEVAGSSVVDGSRAIWTGDPLVPDAAYTATLDTACGTYAWSFRASHVGAPVQGDPTGQVYAIRLGDADWVSPAGLARTFADGFGDSSILVMPTAVGPSTTDLLVGVGSAGVQDPCRETVDVVGAAWADPYVETPATLSLAPDLSGSELHLWLTTVSGAFRADASALAGAAIAGDLDTRFVNNDLTAGTPPDVCELFAEAGAATCAPCPDGEVRCVPIRLQDMEGAAVSGPLVPRTASDIAADPACL